ncbi:MAG: type ISP restriction/modification enzyme, partial [Porticoccaceae bacterium]
FLKAGGRKGKLDFDELGIQEVVDLLNNPNTHLDAVLRDFGNKRRDEDPAIHFYEDFLKAYDKKLKVQRGVFYTPQPVVSYIVRSVHELLQTEFGLEDGLADTTTWGEMLKKHPGLNLPPLTDEPGEKRTISPDEPFVQILDPATGTATFLVEVIDVIHRTMVARWKKKGLNEAARGTAWNDYVPKHLLPRLHAYELMMAPYAIAHMKIGLKLAETGYRFATEERARIYLTNALEPWMRQLPFIEFAALAHEAAAVNEIKRCKRFTVVIGNPPYAGHSSNTGGWISQLVNDYYFVDGSPLGEKNPKWLQDDYVKFIRLGQVYITQSGIGVQSYITNHGYVDNPTFRGMRQCFLHSFNALSVLDLHGNATKKECAPGGGDDINVFDIKQGVAIFSARRLKASNEAAVVNHGHLYGTREQKYEALAKGPFSSYPLKSAQPAAPFYLFFPQDTDLRSEYSSLVPITEFLRVNVLGFQTHRDEVAVAFTEKSLKQQIAEFMGKPPKKNDWDTYSARCSYRLFDVRWVYFSPDVCDRPRRELLTHVVHRENLCFGVGRQGIAVQDPVWSLVSVSRYSVDANTFRRGGINIFPLYLYEDPDGLGLNEGRHTNFTPQFLNKFAAALSLRQRKKGEVPAGLTPEDIFHYAYAVFHSPGYRSRYAEFLKIDFPRLPLTGSLDLFRALARLGGELVALHLLESPKLAQPITEFIGSNREVAKVGYADGTVWIDASGTKKETSPGTSGFRGVPEAVWNFHIGGYQVCEKWLKDRKGRRLSADDITHYHKIVVALSETIRLMAEIDRVIDQAGGWPGAFQTQAAD